MTRNEYLIELAMKLENAFRGDENAYGEIKGMVSFYQEMLDDMIEEGRSEEEAVAAMEPADDVVERIRHEYATADGRAAAPAPEAPGQDAGGRVTSRSEGRGTAVRRAYAPEEIRTIEINDMNHSLTVISGTGLSLEYVEDPAGQYEVQKLGGRLCLRYRPQGRGFLGQLFNFGRSGRVVLTLPEKWDGQIEARTSNAPITVQEVSLRAMNLRTSNARIAASDVRTADRLTLGSSNGAVQAERLSAGGEMELITGNARLIASELQAGGGVKATTSNGAIEARNIQGAQVRLTTSNARISAEMISAGAVTLTTSNGSISGLMPQPMERYAITSRTSNGRSNLPAASRGEIPLDVRTSNGSIHLEFME